MMDKKTILVFGATGNQGASVIGAILRDPNLKAEWHIRGVTRDVSKPSAQSLAEQGVEVVTADLEDKASLRKVMEDCYAVFLVTNYWETLKAEVEIRQGKNAADVAKEVGIQHFIFSSLMNISKISGGKYTKVLHFDGKAEIADYAIGLGLPTTLFLPAVYMSNFTPKVSFRLNPQTGAYTIALPDPTDKPIVPMIDIRSDTGKFVTAIMRNREKTLGKEIYGAIKYYTLNELVEEFQAAKPKAGKGAVAVTVSDGAFKGMLGQSGLPEFAHEEMLENFLMLNQCGYYNGENLDFSHSILSEPLTTFKEFVAKNEDFADLE